ncbi:MAG TPA: hypothetical protein VL992_01480 [Tepidisphaeraceae bacterium]|nr:hypothetical protein [Tepidisphaeraceae bacterium]
MVLFNSNSKGQRFYRCKPFMPKFMVQVVLHDVATPAMYEDLNTAMEKKGFSRELAGKKAAYHLPTGTYWYEADLSPSDLRVKAAAAAETTGEDFGIVVVRAEGWSVMRLKRVEAAPQG